MLLASLKDMKLWWDQLRSDLECWDKGNLVGATACFNTNSTRDVGLEGEGILFAVLSCSCLYFASICSATRMLKGIFFKLLLSIVQENKNKIEKQFSTTAWGNVTVVGLKCFFSQLLLVKEGCEVGRAVIQTWKRRREENQYGQGACGWRLLVVYCILSVKLILIPIEHLNW